MNTLDGFTILRFARVFKSGGGLEHYIKDVDQILLTRNRLKIVRMYLEKDLKEGETTTKRIGQGNLVVIPMPVSVGVIQSHSSKRKIRGPKTSFLKKIFRELIVYNCFLYRVFFRDFLKRYYPRPQGFEIENAGEELRRIHQQHHVDLLVMHYLGTVDSAEIIEEAKKLGVPYIYINHYSNDYFNSISIREQLVDIAGIAGVSGVGIPRRLKNRFTNLSDGIDLEIFDSVNANALNIDKDIPIIIYPARITQVKGQTDLIKAYAKLKSEGLRARIVIAGRTDSPEYEEELRELVIKKGLKDDVLFAGQLNSEELRDWYAISSILAFPTYHQEGLPRILIEAQAMKVPPVVYIIGGTSEGLLNGKSGFLVPKGDIKTFTRRLSELLKDADKRKEMGEEGRRFVQKNFSLEALAERHEKFYLSVSKK
jgi:glycosyltransferase involved in cell wall biosynthesis